MISSQRIPTVDFNHSRLLKTGKQKGRHIGAALFKKIQLGV
jgi:hypothetical protein